MYLLRVGILPMLILAGPSLAHAQLPGSPTVTEPKSLIGSDVTFSLGGGVSGHTVGTVYPITARIAWSGEQWSIAGSGAYVIAGREGVRNGFGAGLEAAFQITPYRPGSRQVIWKPFPRLHAGAGLTQFDEEGRGVWRQIDVPVALGLGWVLPANQWNVVPWFAPGLRVRVTHNSAGGETTDTRFGGGLAGGLDVYKANCGPGVADCFYGLGLRLGLEVVVIENVRTRSGVEGRFLLTMIWKRF